MFPPPMVGGIELTSWSFSVGAPVVATAINPANGSIGQETEPLRPTGREAVATPLRPLPTGVNTETLPYFVGSLVVPRPSGVLGITSAEVMPPVAVAELTDSAPLPCRLGMTP